MQNEIEFAQWNNFFESINRRNRWRPTRLEVFEQLGTQETEEGLPLVGLRLDTENEVGPRVYIMLGEHDISDPRHLTYTISNATRVLLKQDVDGRDEAVEIDNAGGQRNLLHFVPSPRVSAIY